MTPAQDAAARYAAIGKAWLKEFDVTIGSARRTLSGRAFVQDRRIDAPWPTTSRKRLYLVAHEIGHIALNHLGQLPVYVREFEAEQFAHALMRRDGIAVPRAMTARAKSYVRSKIGRGFVRGGQWFDPDIAAWSGASVVGINWCTPTAKQKHYYDASLRRVQNAVSGD